MFKRTSSTQLYSVLGIVMALSCFELANASDAEKVVNTGQDPMHPITRFDIRYQNSELPDDITDNNNDSDTLILRSDFPVPLKNLKNPKKSWGVLAGRVDLPITSTRTNIPGESGAVGFGSAYLQFLHVVPKRWGNLPKANAWAWGVAAQLATATNGRQKRTMIGIYGSKWNINKVSKGSFAASVLKYYRGPEETGFDEVNEFHIQPMINFNIPKGYGVSFITLWQNFDWVMTFVDGTAGGVYPESKSGDYFIPYDITIGKMLSGNKVVLSGSFAGKLFGSSDYELYHKQFQFRIGYFF